MTDWQVDEMDNYVIEARPSDQHYNGVLRCPLGATGNQRLALAELYIEAMGGHNDERPVLPMGRGEWVGHPDLHLNAREQRLANGI